MKIAIAGTGYVGLVTGVVLAHLGHEVTCVDIDKNKIEKLNNGICPIFEPDYQPMSENAARLTYTSDFVAYADAEAIFIAVEHLRKWTDCEFVPCVCCSQSDCRVGRRDCIVVVKSNVPIGTNDKIEQYIIKNLKHDITVDVVSNPEFLSQGTAVRTCFTEVV